MISFFQKVQIYSVGYILLIPLYVNENFLTLGYLRWEQFFLNIITSNYRVLLFSAQGIYCSNALIIILDSFIFASLFNHHNWLHKLREIYIFQINLSSLSFIVISPHPTFWQCSLRFSFLLMTQSFHRSILIFISSKSIFNVNNKLLTLNYVFILPSSLFILMCCNIIFLRIHFYLRRDR